MDREANIIYILINDDSFLSFYLKYSNKVGDTY